MATKIIISYDGTNNEDDALALGRILAEAGAEPALAYVRHSPEAEAARERAVAEEAETLLEGGAEKLGISDVARHVVEDPSTPEGLRTLAEEIGAHVIVFCSDSHTAAGRVSVGNSARRLLEGGPVAVAIAPAGLAAGEGKVTHVAAVGDGADSASSATAQAIAESLGASVVAAGAGDVDLLVVGSRPEAQEGTVAVTAASENLIEEATCPVLVVPRGVSLAFDGHVVLSA
ncbi:MAG: universal stress protein [Solirubrobacteraceae bacterium]